MENAKKLAEAAALCGQAYRHSWENRASKTPRHLRFGEDGELSYMRDGIVMTSNGHNGSYTRIVEFGGDNKDQHEVEIRIGCDIFSGDDKLTPI